MWEERPLAVAMPPLPHTEVGAAISRLCIWSGSACKEMGGPVWQQVPIRQLESASACVAICPLRLTPSHLLLATEGPGAVPQHKGEAPGWEGQAAFHFAFV